MATSYKDSGVDVTEGYRAVDYYKESAERTKIDGVLTGLGAFNGMFAVPKGIKNPVMVSGTDGVGTKLDVAFKMKKYDTVGIDCVAMSVNDILCSGVKTLFFLDYIACGKLDAAVAAELVKGVAAGCVEAGCALLGGETAEMPGFYDRGKYDLAGFGVGIADKDKIITGNRVKAGDAIIGLSSTGLHSNGFSLVRKLITNYEEPFSPGGPSIGQVLLTPTRIYVKPVMQALGYFKTAIHAMAHITGGGFMENLPRMYSASNASRPLISVINRSSWDIPPIFAELIKRGADPEEVYGTFNMGIGFALCVKAKEADNVVNYFNNHASEHFQSGVPALKAYCIGRVAQAEKEVTGRAKGNKELTVFED